MLTQADFDRLNRECADKLQAFRRRHEIVIDTDELAANLRADDRIAPVRLASFFWREGWSGIAGAVAIVLFVLLLTFVYGALEGENLVADVMEFFQGEAASDKAVR